MKIPVVLNGEKLIFDAEPDESLLSVLHKTCPSVKCGCGQGFCGACTVLLDDKAVATCRIPVGIIKDAKITTLESFSKTEEYADIMKGFSQAGISLCGYCNSGKIFSAYCILRMQKLPSRQEISEFVRHLSPCCTDMETLVTGILNAIALRKKRAVRKTV